MNRRVSYRDKLDARTLLELFHAAGQRSPSAIQESTGLSYLWVRKLIVAAEKGEVFDINEPTIPKLVAGLHMNNRSELYGALAVR